MFDFNSANPLKELADALEVLLWGITGSLANLFVSGRRPSFYALLSCLFVGGFACLIVYKLLIVTNMHEDFKIALAGLAGFGGPITLRVLYKKLTTDNLGFSGEDIHRAEEAQKEADERAKEWQDRK